MKWLDSHTDESAVGSLWRFLARAAQKNACKGIPCRLQAC